MSNEKNQRDDASNPDLPSIRRALRGEDEFKPVFPELQSQNDERVAFVPQTYAGFAAVHLNESGHPPDEQQSFDAGVRAGLARATQQATKGDERAASSDAVTREQVMGWASMAGIGLQTDRWIERLADFAIFARRGVAGSAGQAPDAELVACRDMKGSEWFDIKVFNRSLPHGTKLYAGAAPSLATDAGAVLTDEERIAIEAAISISDDIEAERHDGSFLSHASVVALQALLAAHPTEQRES